MHNAKASHHHTCGTTFKACFFSCLLGHGTMVAWSPSIVRWCLSGIGGRGKPLQSVSIVFLLRNRKLTTFQSQVRHGRTATAAWLMASPTLLLEVDQASEEPFSINTYTIPRDTPNHQLRKTATFLLPPISEEWKEKNFVYYRFLLNSSTDRVHRWSTPRGSVHMAPNEMPLTALRVVSFNSRTYVSAQQYLFFPPSALLKFIPRYSTPPTEPVVIPWEDWGPSRTRLITGDRVREGKPIYGWTLLLEDSILSFNQEEIARSLARGESKAIVTPTITPKDNPFTTEVVTNLPYFETPFRIVGTETMTGFNPDLTYLDEKVLFLYVCVRAVQCFCFDAD